MTSDPAQRGDPGQGDAPPVVVISGPTGAGKTALGLRLAERFGGEILNADSMQVYRGMDIGTAKPSPEERRRVPHHVLDVADPDEPYHAARYAADALEAETRVRARGAHVFLVGGTGLYIRAFLEGLSASVPADPERRRTLEEEQARAARKGDPQRLHRRLAAIDPDTASRLHPNDTLRIVRALELYEATGERPSDLRRAHPRRRRRRALQLVLDPGREALARRINARCEAMIAAGLLQEVRALRDRGYGPELPSMRAIGYRHMQPVLDGRETLAGVLEAMKRDTRQFARRQRTWWRRAADAVWVHPDEAARIEARVARFLAGQEAAA